MDTKNSFAQNKFSVFSAVLVVIVAVAVLMASTTRGRQMLGLDIATQPSFASEVKYREVRNGLPNQYIVVMNEDKVSDPTAEAGKLSKRYGGESKAVYTSVIKGYAATMTKEEAIALSKDARVKFVEQDGVFSEAAEQVNPPSWGLDRIDQLALPLSGAYSSDSSFDGSGTHVYVIDGGIRPTHVDFGGRASIALDTVPDGRNGLDCTGHGTHVAGTIGGINYGVAKGAAIHALRVLDCSGDGNTSRIIQALDWVRNNRINPAVANLSLSGDISPALDMALQNLINSGVPAVVAAGNLNDDACTSSPGRVASAVTVAATNTNDSKAPFSAWGGCVDINAPGVNIVSASHTTDSGNALRSGTSMAAPHVTGVAAILLQKHPGISVSTLSELLAFEGTKNVLTGLNSATPNTLLFSNPLGIQQTKGPRVEIETPPNNYVYGIGSFTVTARGKSALGVGNVTLSLNGNVLRTCPGTQGGDTVCSYQLLGYALDPSRRAHTITATVTDIFPIPRTATQSITIRKVGGTKTQ